MTVEDLFGLAVRLAGLTFIVFGVFDAFHVVATALGLPLPSSHTLAEVIAGTALWLVLGLVLLVSADAIARFAYRNRRKSN